MSLYVLQVVDTAIAQGPARLEKGFQGRGNRPREKKPPVIESWYSTLHTNASLMLLLHDCKVAQVAIDGYRTGRRLFEANNFWITSIIKHD